MTELKELHNWCDTHVKIGSKQARVTLGLIEKLAVAERERDEARERVAHLESHIAEDEANAVAGAAAIRILEAEIERLRGASLTTRKLNES